MVCPNCQTQNEGTSLYCRNCGTGLIPAQKPHSTSMVPDVLILVFIVFNLVAALIRGKTERSFG